MHDALLTYACCSYLKLFAHTHHKLLGHKLCHEVSHEVCQCDAINFGFLCLACCFPAIILLQIFQICQIAMPGMSILSRAQLSSLRANT